MTEDSRTALTVFRALPRARRVVVQSYLPLALIAIPVAALAAAFPPVTPFAVAFGLLALGGIVYAVCYAVRTRVEFGGGNYRQVFAFTERSFTIAEVQKVLPVDALDYGLQSAAHLFVVGTDGRGLLHLNDQILERPQLETLVAELAGRGVPIEHVTERLTIRRFAELHPGVLPWALAHRGRFLAVVALVTLLVLVPVTIWTVIGTVGALTP